MTRKWWQYDGDPNSAFEHQARSILGLVVLVLVWGLLLAIFPEAEKDGFGIVALGFVALIVCFGGVVAIAHCRHRMLRKNMPHAPTADDIASIVSHRFDLHRKHLLSEDLLATHRERLASAHSISELGCAWLTVADMAMLKLGFPQDLTVEVRSLLLKTFAGTGVFQSEQAGLSLYQTRAAQYHYLLFERKSEAAPMVLGVAIFANCLRLDEPPKDAVVGTLFGLPLAELMKTLARVQSGKGPGSDPVWRSDLRDALKTIADLQSGGPRSDPPWRSNLRGVLIIVLGLPLFWAVCYLLLKLI